MNNDFNSFLEQASKSLHNSWNEFAKQIPGIVLAIIIISIGVLIAGYAAKLLRNGISRKTDDPLMINFLSKTIKLVLILVFISLSLKVAGLEGIATSLVAAAGASALILGFAFKDIGENFISGVILSFNRPFNVNDTISIGDIFGKVKTMEFRYTKLKTFDGKDVYVPNSDVIKKAVFNYTEDGFIRLDFIVGIDYEDSIERAEALILDAIRSSQEVVEDENHETFVAVDELATSTVNLKVYFWVDTLEYRKEALKIKSNIISKVKEVILKNGLNLPADIHEIKLYGSQQAIPITIQKPQKGKNQ
ncbi:MAG: mechanosensitive ion channel family protein [Daejeonella sp.]